MAYKIELGKKAEQELDDALAWYQEQQNGLAQEFYVEYQGVEKRLQDAPEQFPIVKEDVRRANFHRFLYSVFFVIKTVSVFILAVFHQKRDPEKWQERV